MKRAAEWPTKRSPTPSLAIAAGRKTRKRRSEQWLLARTFWQGINMTPRLDSHVRFGLPALGYVFPGELE